MKTALRISRWLKTTCLYVILVSYLAATPAVPESARFHHNAWGAESGIGAVYDIRQASDGYLWLQTSTGIFRFDGIRIEAIDEVTRGVVTNTGLDAVLPAQKGGIWLMTRSSGLLFWNNGHITSFPDTRCTGRLREAPDGSLWIAGNAGLFHLKGGVCTPIGAESSYTYGVPAALLVDREGIVWVKTWTGSLLYLLPGRTQFQESPYGSGRTATLAFLHQAPDSSIWLSDDHGFRQVKSGAFSTLPMRDPGPEHKRDELFGDFAFAADGSVWMVTSKGVRWANHPEQWVDPAAMEAAPGESFTLSDGLSSDVVWGTLVDHEGSVWLATNSGLDQLRQTALRKVPLPPAQEHQYGIAAGRSGDAWTGSESLPLTYVDANGHSKSFNTVGDITFVQQDRRGTVWVGGKTAVHLWRSTPAGFVKIAYPAENEQPIISLAQDRQGSLWISLRQWGVLRLADGKWTSQNDEIGKPKTSLGAVVDDDGGNVWFGFSNKVVEWDGAHYSRFTDPNPIPNFAVSNIMVKEDRVWLGGNGGVELLNQGKFRQMRWKNQNLPGRVTGILESRSGDLWINGYSGVTYVSASELKRWRSDGSYLVEGRHFDTLDGLPGLSGEAVPKPTISESQDGRIWFATTKGIAWLDSTTIEATRNQLAPPVVITNAIYNGVAYPPTGILRLPSRARSLEIDYSALSLVVPQRVLFRYKLDGIDDAWQSAGTRRQALYNSLSPGRYHFRVIACNNDGVWNEVGANLLFTVAPAFYQTWWFRTLLALAFAAAIWMSIRLRVRSVSRQLQGRLSERLEERERIARELHDTLLQGLLGLMLRLQFSMDQLPEDNPVRADITKALSQSDSMMQEGRERINHLRTSEVGNAGLAERLELFGHQLQSISPVQFHVSVDGIPRPLDPYIHEEVLLIGREALTNAFRHSGATVIAVNITYRLSGVYIRIQDNGRGIDRSVLEAGLKKDHWGLPNMRERAKKILARLRIESPSGGGTEVELRIPSAIAYRSKQAIRSKLRFIFGSELKSKI